MKSKIPKTRYLLFAFLMGSSIIVSCHKDVASQPPPPPGPDTSDVLSARIIKGKILEYYTESPIADAEIQFSFCRSVTINKKSIWKDSTIKTNNSGEFSFNAEHFRALYINPKGFWECSYGGLNAYRNTVYAAAFPGKLPLFKSADDPISEAAQGISCDSFVVKLIRKKNIQVHIKDSSVQYPGANFQSGAFLQDSPNVGFSSGNNSFPLRQGLDTTFQLEGFGNNWNELSCNAYYGDPFGDMNSYFEINNSFFMRQETDTLINFVY